MSFQVLKKTPTPSCVQVNKVGKSLGDWRDFLGSAFTLGFSSRWWEPASCSISCSLLAFGIFEITWSLLTWFLSSVWKEEMCPSFREELVMWHLNPGAWLLPRGCTWANSSCNACWYRYQVPGGERRTEWIFQSNSPRVTLLIQALLKKIEVD